MGFFDFILRMVFWISLPVLLIIFAIGPARVGKVVRRGWASLVRRRLEPAELLAQVVRQHQAHVAALHTALQQEESTLQDIIRNCETSERNIEELDAESRGRVARGDELGARAALYKLNLERLALASFHEHLEKHREAMDNSRRRQFELELQLRQYEVGRSILLSQLAEARTTAEQYAIASDFDPFNAVANWKQAEGMIQETSLAARAKQRVLADTAEFTGGDVPQVDRVVLEKQLAALKTELGVDGNRALEGPDASKTDPPDTNSSERSSAPRTKHSQPATAPDRKKHP